MVHLILISLQKTVSVIGIGVIFYGVCYALFQFLLYLFSGQLIKQSVVINNIRLNLGRTLILGLEFIVAADLIGSTSTPDYYTVGLLGIVVLIRTILTFSINREITSLTKDQGRDSL